VIFALLGLKYFAISEKCSTFAAVKKSIALFRVFIAGFLITIGALLTPTLAAGNINEDFGDSVEVGLLTCSPHNEVYSLYGHTAIHYRNLRTHEDYAFNYGIFNFHKPFFVARFALGKTDYELGVIPFAAFCNEYRRFGSMVTEQVLNLTPTEKARLVNALWENYKPENRVYRYNFFYDNCATRVRDIIVKSIDGKVIYGAMDGETDTSWRDIIHSYTVALGHPWAAYGDDLCLGVKADQPATQMERHFIPDNLMIDFAKAQIYSNGQYRPLVKDVKTPVEAGVVFIDDSLSIITPMMCSLAFFVLSIVVAVVEYRRKRTFVVWDGLLMAIVGVAGLLLTVLLCSEHPTTSTNLQYMLLNPLPLFFIANVVRRKKTIYWKLSTAMIILFLFGGFFQTYAEGMTFVALALLTRVYIHLKLGKNDNR